MVIPISRAIWLPRSWIPGQFGRQSFPFTNGRSSKQPTDRAGEDRAKGYLATNHRDRRQWKDKVYGIARRCLAQRGCFLCPTLGMSRLRRLDISHRTEHDCRIRQPARYIF